MLYRTEGNTASTTMGMGRLSSWNTPILGTTAHARVHSTPHALGVDHACVVHEDWGESYVLIYGGLSNFKCKVCYVVTSSFLRRPATKSIIDTAVCLQKLATTGRGGSSGDDSADGCTFVPPPVPPHHVAALPVVWPRRGLPESDEVSDGQENCQCHAMPCMAAG